jgi:hypothetical protein
MVLINEDDIPLLKQTALRTHLNSDSLPKPKSLLQYFITLYQLDAEGDKVLISDSDDLYHILKVQKDRIENHGNPPVVKIVADVKPVQESLS